MDKETVLDFKGKNRVVGAKFSGKVNHGTLGAIAVDVLAATVIRAVTQATAEAGLSSYREFLSK
jgi:hypothetical protein